MNKLKQYTTHQTPLGISSTSAGRENYRNLRNLFEDEMSGNALPSMVCAVIGIIDGTIKDEDEKMKGSNFTYGDNGAVDVKDSLVYAIHKLYPSKVESYDDLSYFINTKLIDSGFNVIASSTYEQICDTMIELLNIN